MNEFFAIQIFEGQKVRIVWDAEQEKYYFAVADIVQVLTDSVNPRDYIKKMLRRDPELNSKWGTICPPVEMLAPDGKHCKTLEMSVYVAASRTKLYNFREMALLGQRGAVSRLEKCQFSKRGLWEGKKHKTSQ